MNRKRPRTIIFNPDQMYGDVLGHPGNPAAITPNLDGSVMEDAVSFSNAFCQNPVCVPFRRSFLIGLYPHVSGYRTMSYLLHPGEESLFSELRRSGYYVWMNDRSDLTVEQIPGWTESHADEIHYSGQTKRTPGPVSSLRRGPGDKYYYSHHEGGLGLDESRKDHNGNDEVVDTAIERLKNPADERPVYVFLGLFYPYMPYRIEEPYFSSVNREKLSPRISSKKCSEKSKILDRIKAYQSMDSLMKEDWRELRIVYLGMCGKVDDLLDRLLRTLKETGIYSDCAISFLSNHGDYMGDYDMVEKCQNGFKDRLTGVPLLVKPLKGTSCRSGVFPTLTELIDLYTTAMGFTGTKPSHAHFGKSLRSLLANPDLSRRSYVFCEGGRMPGECHCDEFHECGRSGAVPFSVYQPRMIAQTDDEAHGKGIMIRNEHYRYTNRTHRDDEFYHLDLDPMETKSCMDDGRYEPVVTGLRLRMLKWSQATNNIVPLQCDKRLTPEIIRARVCNQMTEGMESLIREMITEGKSLPKTMQFCREYHGNRKAKGE